MTMRNFRLCTKDRKGKCIVGKQCTPGNLREEVCKFIHFSFMGSTW